MSAPEIQRPTGRGHAALTTAAVLAVFMPESVLSTVADTQWEVEVLRMLTFLVAALVLVWPWARDRGGMVARRLHRWSVPGGGFTLIYLVSSESLHLFVGFCLLAGGALDMWTTRAHEASESLRAAIATGRRRRDS